MTTPTAIEAVAKAICCPNGCRYPGSYLCTSGELREHATAAIAAYKAAIRDATDEMALAAITVDKDIERTPLVLHLIQNKKRDFRAMLDKA